MGGQMSEQDEHQETAPVVATDTAQRAVDLAWGYDPDRDFRKLALEAQYFSKGFRLVSKEDLIGIPHVIIGVTYRPGFPRMDKAPGDYVSVEAVVADKITLDSPPVRRQMLQEPTVWGNEAVVYNDSGTGVRRELTSVFHTAGLIDVGPEKKDENRFDRQFQKWARGEDRATTGIVADFNGNPFRYLCLRGLQKSDYESPYGPATTFYIA